MNVEICKWYNNADSPVLFFIDDLANVWVDINGDGKVQAEEDWGYLKDKDGSAFNYLLKEILVNFPYVKVTFFVPVGERVGMIKNPKIKSISKMINADEESKNFFKSVHESEKFEIAYHGTTHGQVGDSTEDFKQEWETYTSLEDAIHVINRGKEIYRDTIGVFPEGGKYCGYTTNSFSDESIDRSDFVWWCRYWNRGLEEDKDCRIGGEDSNPKTNYDIKMFGKNNVVDIPSTINGGMLNDIFEERKKGLRNKIKRLLKKYFIKKRLLLIDSLLREKLVISIQEHISPARDDGKIQYPNIFSDNKSIITILQYLKQKNVWYCTGSELAHYYKIRNSIGIKQINQEVFSIEILVSNNKKQVIGKEVTIKVNTEGFKYICIPNGSILNINDGIINVPILDGRYQLIN